MAKLCVQIAKRPANNQHVIRCRGVGRPAGLFEERVRAILLMGSTEVRVIQPAPRLSRGHQCLSFFALFPAFKLL